MLYVCVCSYLNSLQTNSMGDLELYSTPKLKNPDRHQIQYIYKNLENWNHYIQFYKHFNTETYIFYKPACL